MAEPEWNFPLSSVLSTSDYQFFLQNMERPADDESGASTESTSQLQVQVKWSRPEVLYLLSLYKEREVFFKDKKSKKKTLWEEIAKEMEGKGYAYSGSQCETKFKNLKQNFTKTVDHNNVSGNDKKTCPYFEELSDIFGMTPAVKPVAVCANRSVLVEANSINDGSGQSGSSASSGEPACSIDKQRSPFVNKETPRKSAKRSTAKRALQSKESLVDLFKEYQREQREKEEEKDKLLREMHQQKMQRFDRLLDLYEKDISK